MYYHWLWILILINTSIHDQWYNLPLFFCAVWNCKFSVVTRQHQQPIKWRYLASRYCITSHNTKHGIAVACTPGFAVLNMFSIVIKFHGKNHRQITKNAKNGILNSNSLFVTMDIKNYNIIIFIHLTGYNNQ